MSENNEVSVMAVNTLDPARARRGAVTETFLHETAVSE
jgi:hypothetical protein